MTMTDSVGRIQQIQSTLTMLAAPRAAAVLGTPPTGSTAGGAAMSTAVAGKTTASPAAPASPAGMFAEVLAATGAGRAPDPAALFGVPPAVAPVAETGTGSTAVSGAAAQVVEAAKKYQGVPYVWGGTDPASGLDCSGFVQRAYADIGIELPRVTWDQMNSGIKVDSLAEAQPGDLLFSLSGGHVSMYLGGNQAIDAPQPGKTVAVRDLWETDANLTTIRRVVPAEPAGAAASTAPEGLASAAQAAFVSGRSL
ncbi:C40 family peptidase [Arthrobacter sp. H41]|uniref:C40 family peptidase n=1 Tax=Arthrobacter sp. H41 TaxID=1312978 RepID=UPI0004B44BDC|nr:C40 family peptidase [Arthrobacter sp. H41]